MLEALNYCDETVEITDIHGRVEGVYHIPYPQSIDGGGFQTLCGFCDVSHEKHNYKNHRANCSQCIDVLSAVKAMRFPRNYKEKKDER